MARARFGTIALATTISLLLVTAGCANAPWRVEARNTEIVRKVVEAINAGRLDQLDELVDATYVRHCQATPDVEVNSLEDFKKYLEMERAVFPDGKLTISSFTAQGDRVAFWGTYSGTQKGPLGDLGATGRVVQVEVAGVHRLSGGRIAESWVTWDNLAALRQLDLMPELPAAREGVGEE